MYIPLFVDIEIYLLEKKLYPSEFGRVLFAFTDVTSESPAFLTLLQISLLLQSLCFPPLVKSQRLLLGYFAPYNIQMLQLLFFLKVVCNEKGGGSAKGRWLSSGLGP
jgi:hypothetical protein